MLNPLLWLLQGSAMTPFTPHSVSSVSSVSTDLEDDEAVEAVEMLLEPYFMQVRGVWTLDHC